MRNRRSVTKLLHWLSAGLILWFFLVEPETDGLANAGPALSTHAGVGLVLATATLIWCALYWTKGALGRPGPKLSGRARWLYPWLTTTLYYGLPAVVLSGALAGLAAPFAIRAFDILPVNFAGGNEAVHSLAEDLHEVVFNAVMLLILAHGAYHIWRHFWLRDNALRIMVPKLLHRWL